jgi:glycosyltransferase involved in cell wall biosynthesis
MSNIIHLFFPGPFGGAEKVIIKGLSDLKNRSSIKLWIVKENRCPQYAQYFEDECKKVGIDVTVFSSDGIFDFKLLKQLRSGVPEEFIVHAHGMKASFYGAFLPGKLVVTHHGHTSHTFKVKIYELIQEMVMRRADAVISVSVAMKEELDSKNIDSILIENMLSITPVTTKLEMNQRPKFIFIGRLSSEKGADKLVSAFSNIKNVDVSIIGDGAQREYLENKIEEENLHHIKLLGFHSDVSSFIQSADALVMPSLREGLPMTLLEAICSGLPVIGSDVGGLKALVKHNGILVPPGDIVALEQAVQIFLERKEVFKKNAEILKTDFIRRFSVENWSKKTLAVYLRLSSQS